MNKIFNEHEYDTKPGTSFDRHLTEPASVFFNGKLRIFSELDLSSREGDVLVNFCASDILSGDETFLGIHELSGDKLKDVCVRYKSLGIGSCRFTDSFGLNNFKKIAHCILPRPVQSDDCVDIDELVEFDLMLCYRNVMDLLIEKGYNSVVFTHPLLYMDKTSVVTLAVTVLTYWMEFSVYAEKLNFISIVCSSKEISQYYINSLDELSARGWEEFAIAHSNVIYSYLLETFGYEGSTSVDFKGNEIDPILRLRYIEPIEYSEPLYDLRILEVVFEREYAPLVLLDHDSILQQYQQLRDSKGMYDDGNEAFLSPMEDINLNQFCIETYGFDETYIRQHPDEVYEKLFYSPDGVHLQLSRNLSHSILSIEEKQGGLLRQYRMTTQNREGETFYFRCSRCESLMRYTNEQFRPKIIFREGLIQGDCYPSHHPQCFPANKEWVILQQLHRQARLYLIEMTTAQQFENFDENYGEDHEYGQEFVFNDYLPDSNLQQRNKDFGQREPGLDIKQETVDDDDLAYIGSKTKKNQQKIEQNKIKEDIITNGKKSKKFRIIRKRGGMTDMAFDWRETDFNDGNKGMKK
uniref:Macro domain-containing protein n=2 Tax=Meloidogyne incognita group TaxID=654580 RepID=A0A914LS18_MELIC